MAVRKTKKEAVLKKAKKETLVIAKYFYAVGRRKASIAQVRLYPSKKASEDDLMVNKRKINEYFPLVALQNSVIAPLRTAGAPDQFKASIFVRGGGNRGQAEAIRLGIARALVKFDSNLKKSLKDLGFLTRDSRIVERKKPGLKKARRAPQWQKR